MTRPRYYVTGAGLTPDERALLSDAGGRREIAGVYVNDGPSSQTDRQPLDLFLMKFWKVLQIEYTAWWAVVGANGKGNQ